MEENYDKRKILSLVGIVDDSLKERALKWVLGEVLLQDFVWGLSSISSNDDNGLEIVKN